MTHSFVILPPKRHTPWTNVIGFSRLLTTRGLSAFSTALPDRPYTSFTHDHLSKAYVCWMTPGDGSRPAVGCVGMFQTAPSEQRRWVALLSSNLILISMRKPRSRRHMLISWTASVRDPSLGLFTLGALAAFVSGASSSLASPFSICLFCCSGYLV